MSSHHSHHSHHEKSKTTTTTTTTTRTGIHVDEIHAQIPANFPPAELDFNQLSTPPGFHYAPILENPLKPHHTEVSVAVERPAQELVETPMVERGLMQEVTVEGPLRTSGSIGQLVNVGSQASMKSVRTENELRTGGYLNEEVKSDNVATMAEIQESSDNIHSALLQQIRDTGPIARILQEHAANRPLITQQFGVNPIEVTGDQWTDKAYEEMLPEDTGIKSRRTFVQDFGVAGQPSIEANQDYTKLAYGAEVDGNDKKTGMEFAVAGTGFLPPMDKKIDENENEEKFAEDKGAVSRAVDTMNAAAGTVAGFIASHMPGAATPDTEITETTEKTTDLTVDVPEGHHTGIMESMSAAVGSVADYISAHMSHASTADTENSEIMEKTVEVEVTATNVPEDHHAGIVESMAAAAGSVAGFISAHMPHAAETGHEEGTVEVTEDQEKGLVDSAMDRITSFFSGSTTIEETQLKEETEGQNDENGDAATDITEVTEVETTLTEALEQEQEPKMAGTEAVEVHEDYDNDQEAGHIDVTESETMSLEATELAGGMEETKDVKVTKKSKNHKKKHGK